MWQSSAATTDLTDAPAATFGHPAVLAFLGWAAEKSCYAGAARLAAICGDLQRAELLGGIVHYVSRSSTADLLASWSEEFPAIRSVHRLAVQVWGSQDPRAALPVVNPLRRLDESLRGFLTVAPLAAMCSAGYPSVAPHARVWIDTLRTLLLTVSLSYAEDGNIADRHVATVARYLRSACDDRNASPLLDWLLRLSCDAQSITALSTQLVAQLAGGHRSAPAELVTALRAIALRRPLPDRRAQVPAFLPPVDEPEQPAIRVPVLEFNGLTELPVGDGDVIALGMAEAQEDQTPEQSALAAKGVLIENLEALQYLEYSWQQVNPEEASALIEFVQSLLASAEPNDALLGAFAAVALLTQHSLDTVGGLALGSSADENWSLDVASGTLRRLPGRRAAHWRADPAALPWIRPLADQWEITLATDLAATIRRAASQAADLAQLSDLWLRSESAERAFNAACRQHPILRRVSSGHVRRILQTALFRATNDATFARLATTSSRSALPGACAYPAWQSAALKDTWLRSAVLPWVAEVRFGSGEENALGSELDPIEPLLREQIRSLHERLVELAGDPSNWVEYHNALTTYLVIALLAATGARPIDSPFESSLAFDWKERFVYLDDKAVASTESGRSVPLPRELVKVLKQIYLPHLALLAGSLQKAAPDITVELAKLKQGHVSKLPFFFFLRSAPFIDWMSVSPASLDALNFVQWALPWNLMRHRLATRLRAEKVDPEVIDGLLGHSEAGAQTWGDTSLRSWRDDMRGARPALQAAFAGLQFDVPPAAGKFEVGSATSEPQRAAFDGRKPFGHEARRAQRSAAHQNAKAQANVELDEVIAGRPLSSLSKDDLEALGRSMILTAKGLPRPYADLRYELFEKRVRAAWDIEGKRPPLRQRFALNRAGTSPFSAQCVGATALRDSVCAAIFRLHTPRFRPKPVHAAYLAALSVCALDRVTDAKILQAIIDRADNSILVRGGRAWLEHRANSSEFPNQPAPRFPISALTARWLDIALSGRQYSMSQSGLSEELRQIAQLLPVGGLDGKSAADSMLASLACTVRQTNALELPGAVAAYLDGRVIAWGVPISDWLRLQTGVAPALSPTESFGLHATVPEATAAPRHFEGPYRLSKPASNSVDSLEDRVGAGRAMLSAIRRKLEDYAQTVPRGQEDTAVRRNLRRDIGHIGKLHPTAPSAIAMLAAWIYELLERRPQKPHFLRPSTVSRYLGALANRFLNHAHDLDLAELDTEELTELYGTMLDAGSDEGVDTRYVAQRLCEFHRFAQREFGLDDPDWSEIDLGGAFAVGSPGIVLEPEYLHALKSLAPNLRTASRADLCTAFLLLAAFRFGLRGREAYGLLRDDWADHFETLVAIVRANGIRPVKSPAGRRQVPSLCQLDSHENALLRRFLATWDEVAQGEANVPLFALDRSKALPSLRSMRDHICAALRASARSSHLTLHHCRHAFASELFLALLPLPLKPRMESKRWMDSENVQRLLLGNVGTTRRALWALSRTLGHARPTTTLRSYVHLLGEVCEVAIAMPQDRSQLAAAILKNAVVLDGISPDPNYLRELHTPAPVAYTAPTTSQLVRAAQLLSRGQSAENAAHVLGIDESVVKCLSQWIAQADARLKRTARKKRGSITARQRSLLHQIMRRRWGTLLAIASCDSSAGRELTPPDNSYTMVAAAMQLLMWRPEHFRVVAAIREDLKLQDDIAIYETDELDAQVRDWANAVGLIERRSQTTLDGVRVFQIDGVTDGQPHYRVVHRCAAARQSDSAQLRSGAEWLLLFACYTVSRMGAAESLATTSSGRQL